MSSTTNLGELVQSVALGELVISRAGKTPARNQAAYWGGDVPWVTAKDLKTLRLSSSRELISTFAVDDGAPMAAPGDVLILVRGMTLLKDIPVALVEKPMSFNQDIRSLRPLDAVSGEYLVYLLSALRDRLLAGVTQAGHGTGRLDVDQLMSTPVPVPPVQMQQWLVEQFRPLGRVIRLLGNLISAKREFKRGLMQELLTGRRRFPEFGPTVASSNTEIGQLPDGWQVMNLGVCASEVSRRNAAGWGAERVMGVIKDVGLEPMRDHVRAKSLSRYKVVPPNAFAYNPMRLNIGSIARSHLSGDCLVSPDYVVFETDTRVLLPEFLDHLRHSEIWRRFVYAAGSGSVRVRIYFRDLARMPIPLPPIEEQRRISSALNALSREINLLESLKEQFDSQKRGLLQKLLTGELTVPTPSEPEPVHG